MTPRGMRKIRIHCYCISLQWRAIKGGTASGGAIKGGTTSGGAIKRGSNSGGTMRGGATQRAIVKPINLANK